MNKKPKTGSLRKWLSESYRYVRGGEPIPGALQRLIEGVSHRPNLQLEDWAAQVGQGRISPEVIRFMSDFFVARGVPFGKLRSDDRLQADLDLNQVLAQEWGDELQEEFMDRFQVCKLFSSGPAPDTLGEIVSFVQEELDDWNTGSAKSRLE